MPFPSSQNLMWGAENREQSFAGSRALSSFWVFAQADLSPWNTLSLPCLPNSLVFIKFSS